MSVSQQQPIRIAILDLYEGHENQGMRCIREILQHYCARSSIQIDVVEFDVRLRNSLPDLSFDIYISSGGPGSPLESEETLWEKEYFQWIGSLLEYNASNEHVKKKHVLFICHSFQLACRYFNVAEVTKRKSTAFGVFPVHLLEEGKDEPIFRGLQDPFYVVDSRDYQVINPDDAELNKIGATLLCIEKERPHVPLQRAVMAIRFNPYMIGTQFHPEADAPGMRLYLQRIDKQQQVIEQHGYEKWKSMIEHLNDPDKIVATYHRFIPNFLEDAIQQHLH